MKALKLCGISKPVLSAGLLFLLSQSCVKSSQSADLASLKYQKLEGIEDDDLLDATLDGTGGL